MNGRMSGGNSSLSYSKGEIKLPNDIDPEIRSELIEAGYNLSVTIKKDDGMINADFSYTRHNAGKNGESDYRNFPKTFTNWKEFGVFADKFFAIADDKMGMTDKD